MPESCEPVEFKLQSPSKEELGDEKPDEAALMALPDSVLIAVAKENNDGTTTVRLISFKHSPEEFSCMANSLRERGFKILKNTSANSV